MKRLDMELDNTNALIEKVENVMLELVNAELGIHEERLKYYRVQSHLAKVRILDSSLADLEAPEEGDIPDSADTQPVATQPDKQKQATGSDGDAA